MPEVLERFTATAPPTWLTAPDELPARRTMAAQIERLERELASLLSSAWPRKDMEWTVPARRSGARLLDLAELEEIRDALANRVEEARRELRARHAVEDRNREHIEAMLLDPAAHRWERVSHEDIGEPGCKHWHVLPRWGVVGMFMDWWRVKISSGCPLATCW